MTATMVEQSEQVQALIDARLDTIERMLLGRMPRGERLAVVRDVELQIQEMLDSRGGEQATREDVLAILARLDPPEAFLAEDRSDPRRPERTIEPGRPGTLATPRQARTATIACWLGASAFCLASAGGIGTIGIAILLQSAVTLFILGILNTLTCLGLALAGIVLGISSRKQGTRAILGIVFGAITLPVLVIECVLAPFL